MVLELRSLNLTELQGALKSMSVPAYRAKQILDWLHKKHAVSFSEMKNLPRDLQRQLSERAIPSTLTFKEISHAPHDDSKKYLFETRDGHLLETVWIHGKNRETVCVSTQLGCKMKCVFCASGKGHYIRNLSAGEIVEQISWACKKEGKLISNVVFMGMGEPLDNYDAVLRAIEILTAEWGFGLGGRRITVSTCGITPKIAKFIEDTKGRIRLSISLHSSRQEVREHLMPIAKKYLLFDLIKILSGLHHELHREITFEYTLIKGINDSIEEAKGVAKLASSLGAKINLIPYNPIRELDWESPSLSDLEKFRNFLERKNVRVTLRQTVGRNIHAACGQLRLDRS